MTVISTENPVGNRGIFPKVLLFSRSERKISLSFAVFTSLQCLLGPVYMEVGDPR